MTYRMGVHEVDARYANACMYGILNSRSLLIGEE